MLVRILRNSCRTRVRVCESPGHLFRAHRNRRDPSRFVATTTDVSSGGGLTGEADFHDVANDTLERIAIAMEDLEEHVGDEFDLIETDGVLTANLGSHGVYVINKQTPNRQLWWSSPVSGPKRYNYDVASGRWTNSRDGHLLSDILRTEIRDTLGVSLPEVDGAEV